ncbi:MAG TPA: DAK2 domain-containing protein [Acidimicrobiales bacterium]|nr:DAK2 domain-containing protein [Acidimicrobiales bacterium]
MGARSLGPGELVAVVAAFRAGLERHEAVLNRLNVYPVPDGDTGTNMLATVRAALAELDDPAGGGADLASVCAGIARGSLMGARGNSGVILCQILRGLVQGFPGAGAIGADELAGGIAAAATAAYGAVQRPVEGTILTVAAGAARAATAARSQGEGLAGVVEAARQGATDALGRTPELLPVLAEAGVVDAGGAGLTLLFDALSHVVADRPLPDRLPLPDEVRALVEAGASRDAPLAGGPGHDAPGGLRFEVMYLLEARDEAIPALREVWAGIGDSIAVVGGDGLWNCHIHTNDVGAAIEAGLDAGRPRDIRVTDLAEQVEEEQWVRAAAAAGLPVREGPAPKTSVVAVATGEGIRRIFRSLGVDHVVAGGQSMNPSTAEVLAVVESVPGSEVVLLPNNANILPVARQVANLASRPVRVVETRAIQEGFAALLAYDPQDDADANAAAMAASAAGIVAGEVTRAARAARVEAGRVEAGDYIGLAREGVVSVGKSPAEAAIGLVARLLEDRHEIVTLIEGAGSTPGETRRVTEWLRAEHPGLAIEVLEGGQPHYPYLVSLD